MFKGTFAPWNESSRELSFLGAKVPSGNRAAKILGSEKSLNQLCVPPNTNGHFVVVTPNGHCGVPVNSYPFQLVPKPTRT